MPGTAEGEAIHADWIQHFVFTLGGIGVNLCYAVYLSYINVYGVADDSMLGYMKISIFTAALSVTLLQGLAEKYGPTLMSPRTKYTVCISASVFVMAATLMLMPFMHSHSAIVFFGVLIGLFEGSGMTYLMELASCYSGNATRYVNTGFVLGLLFPVALSLTVGFHKETISRTTEVVFTLIPSLICFMILVIFLVVVATGGFDAAFESMQRRAAGSAGESEDSPLLEEGNKAVEKVEGGEGVRWFEGTLGLCILIMILTHTMSAGFAPVTQVVASLAYAHRLMLVRFTAEFVGRFCAHLSFLQLGARAMLWITGARVVLLVGLVYESFALDGLETSGKLQIAYAAQVWLFYVAGSYVNSEIMAIAVDSRPSQSRTVAYLMMVLTFGSNVASLVFVVITLQSLGIA
jgi:hypothetical protein